MAFGGLQSPKRTDVFLLKLPGFVPLHKCGLPDSSIADQDQFELWGICELVIVERHDELKLGCVGEKSDGNYELLNAE